MKYMGSKRWMLKNGLGRIILAESANAGQFIDLFTGSSAVARFAAQNASIPVCAFDLQAYAAILARAVIMRTNVANAQNIWTAWMRRAKECARPEFPNWTDKPTQKTVEAVRAWCSRRRGRPITQAYGGHYFSPEQAIWIDALRLTLPESEPNRSLALAALLEAASECAASPGHTAQPLQPTKEAKPFLFEAWKRDVLKRTKKALERIAAAHAKRLGYAKVANANEVARLLTENDLVFIDSPYSGVHYSRFYHVLETIAVGHCGEVFGTGRYPDETQRPRSLYSVQSESEMAMDDLLETIASTGARAILTYPDGECSNGLSGADLEEIAHDYFHIDALIIESRFSTLGGTKTETGGGYGRAARQLAGEMILVLTPK